MGAIQNKRGSVRGAPPEVYAPFIIPGDSEECDQELESAALETTVLVFIGMALWSFVTLWKMFRTYIF